MAVELLRGHIKEITTPDKHGAVACLLGDYNIKVNCDLAGNIGKGDDVLLACEQRNNGFHALVVKNIHKGKMRQIDPTNKILLLAASAFVCLLGFVLYSQAEMSSIVVRSTDAIVGFIGLVGIAITLRRLFIINRASIWIRHAEI